MTSRTRRGAALLFLLTTLAEPAWAATTYQVGPTRPYTSVAALPALVPGDVVEIDPGTYHEVRRWTDSGAPGQPITIRGVGAPRPVFDAEGLVVDGAMPNPRAVFQVEAGDIVLENLELTNARNGDNGAGIRVTGPLATDVVIRNCAIHHNDMGIMSDRNDRLLIEGTEIAFNGTALYDGYSHNLYLGGGSTTLRSCYIHDATNGQNLKSRGHFTAVWTSWIADSQDGEVGLVDAAETATPDSHAVMIGCVVVSKPREPGYNSQKFIQFGQDSGGAHSGTLYLINNTFIAGDGRIKFLSANATGAAIVAVNNIFFGSDGIESGGAISGTNNWLPATAAVPAGFAATVQGADPLVVDGPGLDFHLAAGSGCINAGASAPTYLDGQGVSQSGVPAEEYAPPVSRTDRPADGALDIGAFEYGVPDTVPPAAPGNLQVIN